MFKKSYLGIIIDGVVYYETVDMFKILRERIYLCCFTVSPLRNSVKRFKDCSGLVEGTICPALKIEQKNKIFCATMKIPVNSFENEPNTQKKQAQNCVGGGLRPSPTDFVF